MKRKATRRQALATLAITSAVAAAPKLALAGWNMTRKPIRSFGRIYDYLKDGQLRLKEMDRKRITIEDAEFNGEEFINVAWGYCDFVNCHFPASHNIQLAQTANCNFIECEFGPSRNDDRIYLGATRDAVFKRCKFLQGTIGLHGTARFELCEFINLDNNPNHIYSMGGTDVVLKECTAHNYAWRGSEKLTLNSCEMKKGSSRFATGGTKFRPEFFLIDSTFEDAEEILWGIDLKNLTISRCVAEGPFRAQGLIVEEMALYEELTRGFFDFSGVSYHGKLRIRNCVFSTTGKRAENNEEHVFVVNGMGAVDTLIESVVCRSDKPANLSGAYAETTANIFKTPLKNEICVIRNCKIPYVQLNWMHTKRLRLENCEIGQLEIRNGQIGSLEIKNTKYERLDISGAVVEDYAIERLASGVIIDTGSNYDSATGKAKKK
jgi:hypothetical protein